jgi:hypothetical protein
MMFGFVCYDAEAAVPPLVVQPSELHHATAAKLAHRKDQ